MNKLWRHLHLKPSGKLISVRLELLTAATRVSCWENVHSYPGWCAGLQSLDLWPREPSRTPRPWNLRTRETRWRGSADILPGGPRQLASPAGTIPSGSTGFTGRAGESASSWARSTMAWHSSATEPSPPTHTTLQDKEENRSGPARPREWVNESWEVVVREESCCEMSI